MKGRGNEFEIANLMSYNILALGLFYYLYLYASHEPWLKLRHRNTYKIKHWDLLIFLKAQALNLNQRVIQKRRKKRKQRNLEVKYIFAYIHVCSYLIDLSKNFI